MRRGAEGEGLRFAFLRRLSLRQEMSAVALYTLALFLVVAMARFSLRLSYLIPLLFPLALIQRDAKRFLLQWSPFYVVVFLYDSLRSVADELGTRVDYTTLPILERWLCGGVLPTVWLQERLNTWLQGWGGAALLVFYFGHFLLPVITLYVLWRTHPRGFRLTMSSLALVSCLGFVTFLIYPAAPPWMAAREGVIPPVTHWIRLKLEMLFAWSNLPRLYVTMNPNQVAPLPSLHAAYPFLLWLCLRDSVPSWQGLFLVNALVVAFAVTAFGEHYVIDVLAGWGYAIVSVLAARWAIECQDRLRPSWFR